MYDYKFITARKQQREAVMADMHGWRLHTAQLTNTGMWEFIFERSSTPSMPMVAVGYSEIAEGEINFEAAETGRMNASTPNVAIVPQERKKSGRKPKVKMGDV